jgi:hypothetical protein
MSPQLRMSGRWLWLVVPCLIFGSSQHTGAQPLAVNPSAAASDVRNPSSTNPSVVSVLGVRLGRRGARLDIPRRVARGLLP